MFLQKRSINLQYPKKQTDICYIVQNNANKEGKGMAAGQPYQALEEYMQYLEAAYNLHLCVKDYVGFIPIDKGLSRALMPYLGHGNPYCMYIKQSPARYHHCLSMMKKIAAKCTKCQGSFCGTCYAGVGEYVTPVLWEGRLLGAVTAGFAEAPKGQALARIARAMEGEGEQEKAQALELYRRHITPTAVPAQVILPALGMVASFLAMTYRMARESLGGGELTKARKAGGSEEVFRQALAFLHQEYPNRITVSVLADVCHCSESYLNHLMKKRLGVSVSTYVNKLRVERAKAFLLDTNDTMLSIAMRVGFSDANYFARVFQQLIGISPSEFRRRYR